MSDIGLLVFGLVRCKKNNNPNFSASLGHNINKYSVLKEFVELVSIFQWKS